MKGYKHIPEPKIQPVKQSKLARRFSLYDLRNARIMESLPLILSKQRAKLRISQRNSLIRTKLSRGTEFSYLFALSFSFTTYHLHRVNILNGPLNPRSRLLESSQRVLQVDIRPSLDIPLTAGSTFENVCVRAARNDLSTQLVGINKEKPT